MIADKWGIKNTFLFGLILFIAVYIGFAFVNLEIGYWILFFIYGIYAACTEGIAKAWITNIVPGTSAGTAIGAYTGLASMAAFGASALAGVLWAVFGPEVAFGFTACVVTVVVLYLMRVPAATKA
ncbi:MAG: MFS transporter [Chitinophagaceae bacterium]